MKSLLLILSLLSFNLGAKPIHLRGIYSRVQITQAHSAQLRIIGEFSNLCTGTLIGPKHVLTAAHCVYNQSTFEWQNNLDFIPGKVDSSKIPFGRYEWRRAYAPSEFINGSKDISYDYALVELVEPIGNELGWAEVKTIEEVEFITKVKMTGYPGDKPRGTLWTVTCPAEVQDNKIVYLCDTFAGMSGSALFSQEETFIVGVHSYGGIDSNGGVSLNQERLSKMRSWMKGEAPVGTIEHENTEFYSYHKLYAQNNCKQAVSSFFSFFDFNRGYWTTIGELTLLPGMKSLVGRTPNTFYYLWGESYENKWSGVNYISTINGSLPMIESRIISAQWGDWIHFFNCNG